MTSFEYQEALKNAARGMVRVKNPTRLLKMIVRFIDREVELDQTSILIFDQPKNRYYFVASKGNHRIPVNLIRLDADNPLIQWFLRKEKSNSINKDFLTYKQILRFLNNWTILDSDASLQRRLEEVKEQMELFKASVCVPGFFKGELLGIFLLGHKLDGSDFSIEELSFFQTLANDASMAIKMSQYHEVLMCRNQELEEKIHEVSQLRKKERETYYQIIFSLAREVHTRDAYTYGHLEEVEKLGVMTAQEMGLDLSGRKRDILVAALHLHDVGKIGVPDSILKKEDKLTEDEWLIMRDHALRGAKILEPLDDFEEVAKIVLLHHENYDGLGYPYGLKGEEIPIEARIIAVVDAFHAMVSNRCYRKGCSFDDAIRELERCAGKQFDPQVVQAFIRAVRKRLQPKYEETRGYEPLLPSFEKETSD
ncbi:MAG TPA: HD domain-containing protein [Candidatus Omnitrophota bacterium]|nr:HD domain-containing protein [Candidatus Omnitrophota bacterium]